LIAFVWQGFSLPHNGALCFRSTWFWKIMGQREDRRLARHAVGNGRARGVPSLGRWHQPVRPTGKLAILHSSSPLERPRVGRLDSAMDAMRRRGPLTVRIERASPQDHLPRW